MRCESASRGQKFSKSKKFSTFFQNGFSHVLGLWNNFKRKKKISDFQTTLSPGIAMRSQRRNFPLLVIREGGLCLFGSHGKGTGPRESHCDARVPVEVKNFQSQKDFQLFFKTDFPMFQDSGIILSEKIFFRLSDHSESRYLNQVPKAETSPYLQSEKADFPYSDHMERRLDLELGCLIAMRECQSRSKIFKVKKFSTFFQNRFSHVFDGRCASTILRILFILFFESHFALLEERGRRARSDDGRLSTYNHISGLWDNFKRKNFFRLSDQSESRYRNEFPKAETFPYL